MCLIAASSVNLELAALLPARVLPRNWASQRFRKPSQRMWYPSGSILRPKTWRTKATSVRPCVPGGALHVSPPLGAPLPWLLLGVRRRVAFHDGSEKLWEIYGNLTHHTRSIKEKLGKTVFAHFGFTFQKQFAIRRTKIQCACPCFDTNLYSNAWITSKGWGKPSISSHLSILKLFTCNF